MEVPRSKIVFAVGSFIIGMLLLQFVGGLLQYRLGVLGLIFTELMILAVALVSTLASRLDFRQVFRVKRSSGLEWLGCFLVYLGAFFGAGVVSYLLSWLTPSILETNIEIDNFVMSGGFILAVIGVAILPGICEEAWHRGYLLSSLGSIKSIAARVIIMGLVFGLFHLDPTRFLQTMILGFALSFMRIKTDNMLPSVVFHGLNNFMSLALAFAILQPSQNLPEQTLQTTEVAQGLLPAGILLSLIIAMLALCVLFLALARQVFSVIDRRQAAAQGWQTSAPSTPSYPMSPSSSWLPPSSPPLDSSSVPLPPGPLPSDPLPPRAHPPGAPSPGPFSGPLSWPPPTPHTTPSPPANTNRKQTLVTVIVCLTVILLSCVFCLVSSMLLATG
ncbi:MAG: CPBP family intramembrane metalloprotease [Coriobacteriales bacterium]|jgi:membrane protease YdiL (CAAX protease family)|nr:CPBP family intramembrane metalloprotease [Coriobacteriales bacterium]